MKESYPLNTASELKTL